MNDSTPKRTKFKRRIGNPPKHGAGAIVYRKEIIEQFPELVRYARECRADLASDLAPGGEQTLSAAKRIILDRLNSKILTAGLLDIYMGQHGILRRDRLEAKVLEAEPALESWLHVNRAILRDLMALGLERVELKEKVMTIEELTLVARKESWAMDEAARKAREPDIASPEANGEGSDDKRDKENES